MPALTPTPTPETPHDAALLTPVPTSDYCDTSDSGESILNPQTVQIDSTPGGVRVKLPTLALVHILSLIGVCGGTYSLARPDVDAAKMEVTKIRAQVDKLEQSYQAVAERLARIETNTENIWDDIRERRRRGGANTTGYNSAGYR